MNTACRLLSIAVVVIAASSPASLLAQDHPDLSGTWTFAQQTGSIGSGAGRMGAWPELVIRQTPAELRLESSARLQGSQVAVYRFDGTETTFTSGDMAIKARAAWEGPNLVVTATRTYPGPLGEITVDVKEIYSLAGGKLTLEETESVQGLSYTGKFVYVKGAPAAGVARPAAARRNTGPVPRTRDGKPDMSGFWTGNLRGGITSIEPHAPRPFVVGGPGIIIDPPEGKVPYQEWALKERDRRAVEGITTQQDPEPHCFLSGVPRQWYVMPYQIVQTPKELLALHEYVHASRVIPITTRPHAPKDIVFWQGDSRAHWDGDMLVVDVSNFNGKAWIDMSGNFYSEHAHIVERYRMTDANTIRYEATIEDPTVYTRPYTVAFDIERTTDPGFEILESACHEENQDLEHQRRINAAGAN